MNVSALGSQVALIYRPNASPFHLGFFNNWVSTLSCLSFGLILL